MAASWSAAATRLARAVTRRERGGALVASLGAGALAGGGVALVLAGLGAPTPASLPVGIGLAGGLLLGVLRAGRTPAVPAGAAAWALDRMGAAGEAGLAEATLGCPAQVAPPRVRLKPWTGLPLAVGGALVAALALAHDARPAAIPTEEVARTTDVEPLPGAAAGVGASHAAQAQRERQALEAARVRVALGLGASLEPGPSALTQALEDPAARRAALEVADPGSPLAQALAAGSGAAQDVADRLARGLEVGAALATARRAALAAATADPAHQVPAVRRPLVERHAALLRAPEDR